MHEQVGWMLGGMVEKMTRYLLTKYLNCSIYYKTYGLKFSHKHHNFV